MAPAAPAGTVRQVNENQCQHCMPLGAIIALKGIAGAMALVHGSQGCSTYMRLTCVNHFNEPVDIASSSLNEKQTILGGEANLKKALDNMRRVYAPSVIGVLTTCLAETMGEDLDRIIRDYRKVNATGCPDIIPVPTPSYSGSHTEGYWAATKAVIAHYARPTVPHRRINVMVPHVSPADIREIQRLVALMGLECTLLPDYSVTLDRPFAGRYQKIPPGGTQPADIAAMPGAPLTIQFGATCPDHLSPGLWLEQEYNVPLVTLPLPVGVEAADQFLLLLEKTSGHSRPEALRNERGWLLDAMADAHKHNAEGRAVIYGEPELVYALTRACTENGIAPVVIASGTRTSRLAACLEPLLAGLDEQPVVQEETDFAAIESAALKAGANIAIGHSGGKFFTERHGIPVVRTGFPVNDRMGGQRILTLGYTGTLALLDRITNTLLEEKHGSYRKLRYEETHRTEIMEGI
ncbi:nitrogenase component 1 [Methanoregula sp.]|uniref:nitrogenase component 1 n=1 Tax=Methanoregula sp. TaxID=2052170 RepID=UPI0035654823